MVRVCLSLETALKKMDTIDLVASTTGIYFSQFKVKSKDIDLVPLLFCI